MSANLDRIASVDIVLNSPISNDASFDNVLIIGPSPKGGAKSDIPILGIYNSLEDLTELGFVATGKDADPVGVAASVAFSQMPRPTEIYVAVVGDAVDAETGDVGPQSVVDVLNYCLDTSGWYGVFPAGLSREEILDVIKWTETQTKLCGYPETNPSSPIVSAGIYFRSFAVYPKTSEAQLDSEIPAENLYGLAVAMAVKAMNYHAGEETWALKQLAAVLPSKLSGTFVKELEKQNISYLSTVASKNIIYGGKTNGGEWIDIIRFRDWLQSDMQTRVVNLLLVNPKIPYTDNGIGLVENQMLASLKDGQKYGGIAPTEFDDAGAAIPGYKTSVPLAANISSAQKVTRVLTDCKFTARLAGAIHAVEIKGTLTYEKI